MATNLLSFQLYTDAQLTKYAGSQKGDSRIIAINYDTNTTQLDYLYYFGSSLVNRKLMPTGSDDTTSGQIEIRLTDTLPLAPRNKSLKKGEIYASPDGNNFAYQVTTAGYTDTALVGYTTQVGGGTKDGNAQLTNIGQRHRASEVKLSLTQNGLNSAQAGATLLLGASLQSGISYAKPIYMRINSTIKDTYDATNYPMVDLTLNDCVESSSV